MRTKEEIYKDLRIGNIFQFLVEGRTEYWHIADILTNDFEVYFKENPDYDHSTHLTPVVITEQVLLKCGFTVSKSDDVYEYDVYSIQISNNRVLCFCKPPVVDTHSGERKVAEYWWFDSFFGQSFCNFCDDFWNKPKYLHQLQNLYYSLTGVELNVTL